MIVDRIRKTRLRRNGAREQAIRPDMVTAAHMRAAKQVKCLCDERISL